MDYNDNELQSQNLQLAGEGNAKFSPVLRPYALPKFDFDDSLHGHLRFDSLVETEVFLGIESNEDNQWIEEYSRGSSGIQFRTSAAESCSISRHNNVWSEATSSESVEMLLKSVGQEENIPGKNIMREADACDELGCIIKQMEPVTKHDDNSFSKGGDVQPMLPPDEILGKFSGLKEDVGGSQPLVDVTFQKNECESSVGCGLSDPISDAVSGKGNLPLSKESNDVDQSKVDTSLESPNSKAEENSTASGTQFDSVATSALNISTSSGELNMQDAPPKKNGSSENLEILTTEIGEQMEERHLVQEAETNYQNSEGNAAESRATQLENPLRLASRMESLEEENKVEASTATAGESSNMLKEDKVLHIIEECNENVQDAKCVNQVSSKDFETSPVSFERDKSFERREVEVSNANDSEASLLPLEENKVPKDEAVESSASHGGSVSTSNVESSVAELLSETPITLTSEGVNDDSGVCREDSNAEVNVSSFILGESADENVVSKQNDGNSISVDVTESTRLLSDCSSMDHVVGGDLIMDKGVGCLSLGEGSSKNELTVSKSHSDAITGNESAMEIASLISHDATEGLILHSGPVGAANVAITHQEVKMMNAHNEERQGEEQGVVRNLVSQDSLKEMGSCTVVSDSRKLVHGAEARFLSEKHEEMIMKENHEKISSKDSVADSLPKDGKMSTQPLSVSSQEVQCDADQKVQEDEMLISGDKISGQVAAPHVDGDTLKIHEGSISSTPLSESEFRPVECGSSCTNLDKSTCGSPTVIRDSELSQSENEKKGVKESRGQNNPVQSVSPDSKGNDVSKDERTFTFEVSPIKDSSEREGGKNWKPFSAMQATTTSLTVEGSTATSNVGQLNSKSSQDASRGNPQVSDREIVRSGSKSTSERKPRRAPSKAAGKESAKRGNPTKDTTSVRPSEKGDRTSNVSLSPVGICQLVQSNEMQHYGHVDSSTMKPFLLSTSASTLPDLNTSSSMFQQPFTDLQQVQLRAQIFVYGALIQGTAPDEAYMISAFGGPDGGRSIWETSWRACTERMHGQKSVLNNAETPLQSRSGARPDQATKHGPGKVASSPLGRAISKGTPSPIVNPMIPLSSPLWSIPTPSADTLQSSGMPRSAVMDYPQALSPLHPHQTPPIRSFVSHNASWISQAPFHGTWVASPQTSGFDGSARVPVVPNTETVQLTPAKEPSVPHSSGVKHISSGPMIQGISPTTVFPGTSMLDPRKGTVSASQHSADPKPRKRKKVPVSENIGQIMLHSQSQTEPVPAPIVNSLMSTSVAITSPSSLLSKASTEKVIMPMSPAMSADLSRGNREAQQRASLSEETLTKLKEAKTQAEDAAAFAAAAVGHSQEIWNQLDKQKNSHLAVDVESKLASAAVAIAAAAAVAKAAAAAANVASSAALQAKLMADEALDAGSYGNSSQISGTSHSDSVKDMGKATPASILKGDSAVSGSTSIIFAAREAARRKVEAASAASKRAENMDAIVKAAELAAEAVSQAGIIVAMGDPTPLNELIEAGPEGYWKVPQASSQLVAKFNEKNNENLKVDTVGEGPGTSAKHPKEVPLDNREMETSNQGRPPTLRNMSGESFDDHGRLADSFSGSAAANGKNTKGPKGSKASDLAKTIGVVPESEIGSRSPSVTIQIEQERVVEPSNENSIKEGSCVEVFKEGVRFKAGWFTANVLNLKEGKAYVCYNELLSDEGSDKLKEWVALKGEGDKPPGIRIARPVTAMPFEGTRKRRRAAMGDYAWSVGDRVDAWMQDSWWEGVVTEKNKKEETLYTIHFPAQGETSAVRAWHLRPSLVWKDGEWVEWSSSAVKNSTSHEGDTPQEKRLRLGTVEAKGKDKISKGIDIAESGKSDELTLLDLAANEKLFTIGKSSRDENKPGTLRMIRTGLQKEGSRVVFGVPKPGKKRKFMDVSKHYVVDQASKVSEANNSVKFAKYLMPQSQGSGSRGWKNASRSEPKEKRAAVSKPKVLKSGKPPSVPGRTIPQKDNSASSAVSTPDNGADIDQTEKIKDFARHVENTSGKNDAMESRSLSASEGATETPILFSSMPLTSDAPSKKVSTSNPRTERVTKGKLAPASGKLTRIAEDKVFNNNSAKMSSEVVEPRRSNRRIQPTSRLLEGLQSSLIISKIPSVSHEKSQKVQNRSTTRGNNNG